MPSKRTVWSREGLFLAAAPLFRVVRAPLCLQFPGGPASPKHREFKASSPCMDADRKGWGKKKGKWRICRPPFPPPLGCCQSPSVWAFDSANSQGVGAGRPEPCFRPPSTVSSQFKRLLVTFPFLGVPFATSKACF